MNKKTSKKFFKVYKFGILGAVFLRPFQKYFYEKFIKFQLQKIKAFSIILLLLTYALTMTSIIFCRSRLPRLYDPKCSLAYIALA